MHTHFLWSDVLAIGLSAVLFLICLSGIQQSPDLIWGVVFFGTCFVILLIRPFFNQWFPARAPRVEYDTVAIRSYFGEQAIASIRWDEVDQIAVLTSETGPSGEDIVWMFTNVDRSKSILITGTSPGFPALRQELQQLPDFDHVTLLEAMGCVVLSHFVVWRRPLA